MLKIEWERRKMMECVQQSRKAQINSDAEIKKYCCSKTKTNVEQYFNEMKAAD